MINILKYENCGNIYAIENMYKKLGIEFETISKPSKISSPKKIILPGVGSFDSAMKSLNESGMSEFLLELKTEETVDILGICVGYQVMANSSEEGNEKGLGFFDTSVKKFTLNNYPSPHMGWNSIQLTKDDDPLFKGIDLKRGFYFLHNYYYPFDNKHSISLANYEGNFTCSSRSNQICGVQFHPEKSHENGMKLLKNFSEY